MAYRRLMGYPPYPNSGRAKKYGVPGIMGYQDLWVKGTSTVVGVLEHACPRALLSASLHGQNRLPASVAKRSHLGAFVGGHRSPRRGLTRSRTSVLLWWMALRQCVVDIIVTWVLVSEWKDSVHRCA